MIDVDDEAHKSHASKVEIALVTILSLVMLIFPVVNTGGQVADFILAWLTGGKSHVNPPAWLSVYTQHATLWLGCVGAFMATTQNKHLGLATTSLLPEGRWRISAQLIGQVVAATTSVVLTFAAYQVIKAHSLGNEMISAGIKAWWSEIIVPVSFAGIAIRFIWYAPTSTKIGLSKWGARAIVAVSSAAILLLLWMRRDGTEPLLIPGVLVIGVAFLLGAPVFVVMSGLGMLLGTMDLGVAGRTPIAAMPEEAMRLAQNPTLPAIPLLTLAGYILASGKASERLVRAFKALFGWMPGGLAIMAIMVCALFTTFTGGSGVTILALGGVLGPALLRDNYPEGFSLGLLTAAGSLGLLFAPSLPVVLYGAVAGVAPDRLYLGGLLPGLLLILVVSLYAIRVGIVAKTPRQQFERGELGKALWAAKFDLMLPVVVILAFKSGVATTVQAAALGACYAIVAELAAFDDLKIKRDVPKVMAQSAALVGTVVVLLGMALGFTNYLVDQLIPDALLTWVQAHFHSQWTFLLALNAILLVLGSVFEIYAAIIVLAPLVTRLGNAYGVEPIHLGVVFLANLELGFLFPPMGLNLLLSASRFNKPLPYLYKQAVPFLIIMAIGVLIITYVPAMTSGVVALLHKN
jgi:tripartite ATP-independent transporter DctM subunit